MTKAPPGPPAPETPVPTSPGSRAQDAPTSDVQAQDIQMQGSQAPRTKTPGTQPVDTQATGTQLLQAWPLETQKPHTPEPAQKGQDAKPQNSPAQDRSRSAKTAQNSRAPNPAAPGPAAPGPAAPSPEGSGPGKADPDAPNPDAPNPASPNPASPAPERGERIAKWLARAGVASRRDAERLIGEGAVRLNGQPVTHPATFIGPDDIVQVRGAVVDNPDRTRLWRYHKPDGLMTTHKDPQGRPTVFEKLPEHLPRVVSVGRLDLNSEGLLLLTNDGALARRLELPANGWIRRYRVRVYGNVDPAALARLSQGVTVEGVRYGPIEAGLEVRTTANSWLSVALKEGRNREVRKVMAHLNLQTTRLIRVAYGPFQLGNLERGAVDEITGKVLREQLSGLPKPSSSGVKL